MCLDQFDKIEGFYYRRNGEWAKFKESSHVPTQNMVTESFKRLDLTGDGLADLIFVDTQNGDVVWMENLG